MRSACFRIAYKGYSTLLPNVFSTLLPNVYNHYLVSVAMVAMRSHLTRREAQRPTGALALNSPPLAACRMFLGGFHSDVSFSRTSVCARRVSERLKWRTGGNAWSGG